MINLNGNEIANTGFTSTGYITSVPTVVTSGLVLWYDAGNNASYINSSSYYDCGYGCQYYAVNPGCTNCNTQIKDMSGLGNDGTFTNSTVSYDNTGGYMSFNGTSSMVTIPEGSALNTQTPTVEIWTKTNATTQLGFWFEKGQVNTQYSIFQENSNIVWRQYFSNLSAYNQLTAVTSTYLNTSNWFQIVGTFTSGTRILYVNGSSIVSDSQSGTIGTNTNGMSIGVYGGYNGTRGYYYNGNISIVRVYNRVLNATEILQNFNAGRQRYGI